MHIINTIAPVFLLIILGLMLRRSSFITDDFAKTLNRLAYWVGLPSLIFYKIVQTDLDLASAGKTYAAVFVATIAAVATAYLVAFLMRIPPASWGTFVQGTCRGNIAYIGLAIVIYSLGDKRADPQTAEFARSTEAISVMVLALLVPLYNIVSVTALLLSKHQLGGGVVKRIMKGLITNPLIIASLAGLGYSLTFDSIPLAFEKTLEALGQMALPIALIALGASMVGQKVVCENLKLAIAASVIKVFVAPLAGFAMATLIGLQPGEMLVAMIMLACPTAVASYVLTTEIGGNAPLSARIVVISTILSAISLAMAVGLF